MAATMNGDQKSATGGCMCGIVRYELIEKPISIIHCHCQSCRRHTGAPMVTLVGMKKDHVRFTQGERAIFESSPGVGRGFCSQCGTPLTWEGDGEELGPLVEIHIGTLDNPSAFVPESHLHHDERIPWFEVADELPRHHEWDEGNPYRHGPV